MIGVRSGHRPPATGHRPPATVADSGTYPFTDGAARKATAKNGTANKSIMTGAMTATARCSSGAACNGIADSAVVVEVR